MKGSMYRLIFMTEKLGWQNFGEQLSGLFEPSGTVGRASSSIQLWETILFSFSGFSMSSNHHGASIVAYVCSAACP